MHTILWAVPEATHGPSVPVLSASPCILLARVATQCLSSLSASPYILLVRVSLVSCYGVLCHCRAGCVAVTSCRFGCTRSALAARPAAI